MVRHDSAPGNSPGSPVPSRSHPDHRVGNNSNSGADAGDWTLNPGPASLWPNWTDLARYELGPEADDQVGEGVARA